MESLITEKDILDESKEAFLTYCEEVLTDRAIPNIEDGLLSVHRKILWTMEEVLKMSSKSKFKKCGSIVGSTLASAYFHGDSSCYGALCKLSQAYLMRYPLIEGDGNLGTQEGNDMQGASRYTNAKPSKYADIMMTDFKKEVVPLKETYNGEYYEPVILPSLFPNALVNGKEAIAIGMAHNSLPNNLSEVCDGIIAYIKKDGEINTKEMMKYIKGPDFPLENTVINAKDIYEAFRTGRSKVSLKVRGKYEINGNQIIFTTIPYRTYRNKIKEQITKHIDELEKYIIDFNDESNLGKNRLVFTISPKVTVTKALSKIFALTDLQTTLSYNMNFIVQGTPKLCSIIDLVKGYVDHQNSVMINAATFDKNKALAKIHILEGLLKAVDKINEVISLIKQSNDKATAEKKLIEFLNIDSIQAKAILEMKLGRLTKINKQELVDELQEKKDIVEECNKIISEKYYRESLLIEKIKKLKEDYGDERRTELLNLEENDDIDKEIEDVEEKECVVILKNDETVQRLPATEIKVQKRRGIGTKTKGVEIIQSTSTNTIDYLLIFTSKGNLYKVLVDNIPEDKKGINIRSLAEIDSDEKIVCVTSLKRNTDEKYIIFFTKNGIVKRTELQEYVNIKKKIGSRIPAIKLNDGDSIVNVIFATKGSLVIATEKGLCTRFDLEEVRCTSRVTKGVKGISLMEGDSVIGGDVAYTEEDYLVIIRKDGIGKRIYAKEISEVKRGSKGVIVNKDEQLVNMFVAYKDDRILINTENSSICIPISEIPILYRTSKGNILTKNCNVINATRV